MFKKTYLSCVLSLAAIALPAVGMGTSDTAALASQLNHINSQMNALKRAWNVQRAHIKMAEKASATLYAKLKGMFEKIIASSDFTTKMDAIIDMQFDSIINNKTAFRELKTENNLSDFFPNLKMNEFGLKLYTAMANKTYYLRLGQKLAQKAQDIAAAIKNAQQTVMSDIFVAVTL